MLYYIIMCRNNLGGNICEGYCVTSGIDMLVKECTSVCYRLITDSYISS